MSQRFKSTRTHWLRQQLKVILLLVISPFEIKWLQNKDDIQSLTIYSYSGFWTSIWTSFGACVRTAMDFLSQLQSFLTLRPHKNSAPSKEKPCWRLTEIVSQVSETVSYLSTISTSFSQNSFLSKYIHLKSYPNGFNALILNVNSILFKKAKGGHDDIRSYWVKIKSRIKIYKNRY